MADKYYIYATLVQLDPATVWLRDEHNTRFVLNDDVGILIIDLVAMGSPIPFTNYIFCQGTSYMFRTIHIWVISSDTPECKEDPILQCQNYPSLRQGSIKWES